MMRRTERDLQAWRESWPCFISFLISNSTRGARWFFVISLLGLFATVGVGLVVSNYYAVFVAFGVMFIIFLIALLTAFITGFRGFVNALPTLVEELRGRAPPGGTEVPPCLTRYFGGRAAEVLGRLYSRSLIITFIVILFLMIFSYDLTLLLMMGPRSLMTGPSPSLNETMHTTSLLFTKLFTKEVPTALRITVDINLGILGVVITVVFSLGSLLIGSDAADIEVLGMVRDVRFHSLTWFSIAITLVIVSIMLPPIASIVFIAPMILAITISLMTYLTLATTVIEHMRLPRGRPRRRPGRLRGPWG
jgi:hypothetical protein